MSERPPTPWNAAADALAERVARRARRGAWIASLGGGLLAGAALALPAQRSVGGVLPWALAGAGALLGAVRGARAAARVAPPAGTDAAWALDRLADAGGHGLAAAARLAPDPDAAPPVPVLLPPRGLSLLGAGLVLTALLFVIPKGGTGTAEGGSAADEGAARSLGQAPGTAATPAGPGARAALAREAEEAERVRNALGLSAVEAQDARNVAERLNDPARRDAARAAAAAGSAAAAALAGTSPDGPSLAERLSAGARAGEHLEAQRRADLLRAASLGTPALAPARRALVERYFERGLAPEGSR